MSGVRIAALIKYASFFVICSFFFQLTFHRSVTCRVLSQDQVCLRRFSLSALKVLVFNVTAARRRRFAMLNLVQPPRPYPLRLTTHWEGRRCIVPWRGGGCPSKYWVVQQCLKVIKRFHKVDISLLKQTKRKSYATMVCFLMFLIGISYVLKGDRHHRKTWNEQFRTNKVLKTVQADFIPKNRGRTGLTHLLMCWTYYVGTEKAKLKGLAALKSLTKSDGNAKHWCYAIYCCPLRLIRLMRQSSPPPPASPFPSVTPCDGHISSSLSQAGVRGDVQKQPGSVHTGFNLAELESGPHWGPPKQHRNHNPFPSPIMFLFCSLPQCWQDA